MRKQAKSCPKCETIEGIPKHSGSLKLQFVTRFMLILRSFQVPYFGDYYGLTNNIDRKYVSGDQIRTEPRWD